MKFADVNPLDRWEVLEDYLAELERRIQEPDPARLVATVEVAELAAQGGVMLETMVKQLKAGGGKPFKLGKTWVIRQVSLAKFYEEKEAKAS